MPKGIKGFQKGHLLYKGVEESWFKKGTHGGYGFKKGHVPWNKGKPWSEDVKKKLSDSLKGKSAVWNKKPKSEETKRKLSAISKRQWSVEENREKLREAIRRLWQNPEYREKLSLIRRKLWKDKIYRERQIRKIVSGWKKRPNDLEMLFLQFLMEFGLPFEYVGNGKTLIGGKNPDFISTYNKKIIELMGKYWHKDKKLVKDRINHFKKYGYSTIILWDTEFRRANWEKSVLKKIKTFLEDKNE